MTDGVRRLARRRVASDLLAIAVGALGIVTYVLVGQRVALYVGVYGLVVGTGTAAVTFCLTQFTGITVGATGPPDADAAKGTAAQGGAVGRGAARGDAGEAAVDEADAGNGDDDGASVGGDSRDGDPGDGREPGAMDDTDADRATGVWAIFTGEALETEADVREDTGWLIGRLENVIVLTLVLVGEYTALSIIFAAKSWVRYEDTASEDTTYYLAGTLVNFTYSIVGGIAARWVLVAL